MLGVAHRLKLLRERFERTTLGASSMLVEALHPSLEANLTRTLDLGDGGGGGGALALLREPSIPAWASPASSREWDLADEWIRTSCWIFWRRPSAPSMAFGAALEAARARRLLDRPAVGTAGRGARRRRCATATTCATYSILAARFPAELSAFIERGSHLKKHFQDVLFLDVAAYPGRLSRAQLDGRLRRRIAAFFWLGFTLLPIAPGARAGIGIGTFGVLFAVAYALKDRIKEAARAWLAGRLTRLYGQRMVTLRLPQRNDPERHVVLERARSSTSTPRRAVRPAQHHAAGTRRVMADPLRHARRRARLPASSAGAASTASSTSFAGI